jgi:phage baseplate assembly protein gpV
MQGNQMSSAPNSGQKKGKLSDVDFAKALVRMKDEVRKTNVREFMANSVMSDRQWSPEFDS